MGEWSEAEATAVPEIPANPVLLALAGMGVVGIGMVRRSKARSAAN